MFKTFRLLIIMYLFVLEGCLLKPEFDRPRVIENNTYRDDVSSAANIANMKWWELFHDHKLKSLISTALLENRDLQVAIARIDEARAILGVTRADQFPRVDIVGNAARSEPSRAMLNGISGGTPMNEFSLLGQLAFEIDIWGKYASATAAQQAQLLATEEFYRGVRLVLVSEVARTYLQLLDIDRQLVIAERTLEGRHSNTKLISERFKEGYTAKIDLNQAQIQEYDAAAAVVVLKRARRQAENGLSVLLGHTPHAIERAPSDTNPISITEIPAGVPAELLDRRPDVRAAEEIARAAAMRVGVARSSQFPAISLLGVIGLNSRESTELFTADGRTWSVGGNLLGPLVDFGKSWSRTEAAEAQAIQAVKTYEGVVLQAVREVEDAMLAVRTFNDEYQVRYNQVKAARSADLLSRRRYNDGVTSYLEVLSTQESLFGAELAKSNTQQRYLSSIVQLYKALGGGWNE